MGCSSQPPEIRCDALPSLMPSCNAILRVRSRGATPSSAAPDDVRVALFARRVHRFTARMCRAYARSTGQQHHDRERRGSVPRGVVKWSLAVEDLRLRVWVAPAQPGLTPRGVPASCTARGSRAARPSPAPRIDGDRCWCTLMEPIGANDERAAPPAPNTAPDGASAPHFVLLLSLRFGVDRPRVM